jgi:hypothetical protein
MSNFGIPGVWVLPMVRKRGAVTRFTVMAILQAARAQALGLDRDAAYSWGLNRAIFYAAAKRGFRATASEGGADSSKTAASRGDRIVYRVGEDEGFRDPASKELRFIIGESAQTPEEFVRQVASRFGSNENFRSAWREAERIISEFDAKTLRSRREFYELVYKPRRDDLSEAWTRQYATPPSAEP